MIERPTDPRARLRALLAGDRAVTMATVYDPISARIAEDVGFEAALMGGSLASHAVLGAPDLIVLTLTELAEQVGRCTRVSNVPILVDGDHGYGNALNAMRTVQELDRAAAAAVMIEDTVLPRPYGGGNAMQLLSLAESVDKIRAAVAARGDSDLLVLGRTGAAAATGIDDAIARLRAFEAAGVDALFLPALRSRDELDRIAAAAGRPIVLGGAGEALADPAYLASRNVRLWSAGHQVFSVAVKALYDAMKAVADGTPAAQLPGIASPELLDRLLRTGDYRRWTREFLGGGETG